MLSTAVRGRQLVPILRRKTRTVHLSAGAGSAFLGGGSAFLGKGQCAGGEERGGAASRCAFGNGALAAVHPGSA